MNTTGRVTPPSDLLLQDSTDERDRGLGNRSGRHGGPPGRDGNGSDGAGTTERYSELTPVGTVKFVVPDEGLSRSELATRLRRKLGVMIDPEMPRGVLVVRGEPEKLSRVARVDGVARVRQAYRDSDGHEMILTDEVLVGPLSPAEGDGDILLDLCKPWGGQDPVELPGNVWAISLKDDAEDAPLDCAQRLDTLKGVAFAEPNFLIRTRRAAVSRPEDCLFRWQWHLNNTGQGGGTKGADVDALGAWELTYGSPAIAVVVHDSGVDLGHPDLAANLEPGWDFDTGTPDPNPLVMNAHGTACAGIIAAALNGQGIVGIAPNCKVVPLRIAWHTHADTMAASIRWAESNGHVISCSWSMPPGLSTVREAFEEVARLGRGGKGTPIFCASGNVPDDAPRTVVEPASFADAISVGASTNFDLRADYSCYGDQLDFVAPSDGGTLGITTADIRGNWGYNSCFGEHGEYCHAYGRCAFGGTSAATPLAAGTAALMLSLNPCLSGPQVRAIMRETAEKIGPTTEYTDGRHPEYGFGRIHAHRACQSAKDHVPVALIASNDNYVSVSDDKEQEATANNCILDPHATFQLVRCPDGDGYALRAHSGRYIGVANDGSGLRVIAQGELRGEGSSQVKFAIEKVTDMDEGDKHIRLKHLESSQYVKVLGNGTLEPASDGADDGTQFLLLRSHAVALKSKQSDRYVKAGPPGSELEVDSEEAGTWEAFILTEVGESEVMLQAVRNDRYVVVPNDGAVLRMANGCQPDVEQPTRLQIRWAADDVDVIQLIANGLPVYVREGCSSVRQLVADGESPEDCTSARFQVVWLTDQPGWNQLPDWLNR